MVTAKRVRGCSPVLIALLTLTVCHVLSPEINECSEGTSGCDQFCSNTEGSFQCGCDNGFRLSGNGRTCNGMYVLE